MINKEIEMEIINMKMTGYKAFDKNFKCRDFEFKIGKEYEEEEAILCSKGFHFCENPLDTLNYYNLCESKFAIVEADDVSKKRNQEDTKRCSKKMKIKTELSLKDFIKFSFEYLKEKCENKYDDKVLATSGGYSQIATSGDYSQVELKGEYSVGMCVGINSKIKGKIGNWITISEWEYSEKISAYIPVCVKTCQIDGKEIKEDVFYKLEKGEFVEC